ncbi:MAG: AraC family transcriptional regulator [Lachnospiraceae bacterium]|nr:AraC family transcriptional regulator [Lachnospiraceae bacterium]
MEWIQGMNAAVNFIEEHILEDPDLDKLGKLAGCSPHHFQRIFTYIGGVTLTEYLRRRRMSLAAVDLKDENAKVIDIALKYGYDSPTAFNRAFQSIHGISPTQARDNKVALKAFPPIVFQMTVRGTQEMNYRIEKRDAFRVVGKRIALKPTLEENFKITPGFWQQSAIDGTIEKLAGMMDTDLLGLMGVSTCNAQDDWEYYIAVATTKEDDSFEEFMIPSSTWAVFYQEGPLLKVQELEARIVTEWLPTSGYEYANAPEIEMYYNPDPDKARYEIWLPIVRKGE